MPGILLSVSYPWSHLIPQDPFQLEETKWAANPRPAGLWGWAELLRPAQSCQCSLWYLRGDPGAKSDCDQLTVKGSDVGTIFCCRYMNLVLCSQHLSNPVNCSYSDGSLLNHSQLLLSSLCLPKGDTDCTPHTIVLMLLSLAIICWLCGIRSF